MSAQVLRLRFRSRGVRVEREEPGEVVPLRTPWRTLRDMADARRLEGIALIDAGEDAKGWERIADANRIDGHARGLRQIEEAALAAQARSAP